MTTPRTRLRKAAILLGLVMLAPTLMGLATPLATALGNGSSEHVRYMNADGTSRSMVASDVDYDEGTRRLVVTAVPLGTAGFYALLERAWADHLVPDLASSLPYDVVTHEDQRWYRVWVEPGPVPEPLVFESFRPDEDKPMFTRGSGATVLLGSRPMMVTVTEVPHEEVVTRTVETANGTFVDVQKVHRLRLAIDFDDGNPEGQAIHYDALWLRSLGFKAPAWAYEDGTRIPSRSTETGWVVEAPHFTTIYTFDTTDEGFTKENAQAASEIAWDNANDRVSVTGDRTDPGDEIFKKALSSTLTTSTTFTVTSRWQATTQGNWQGAMPIFLTGSTNTDIPSGANTISVYYSSRDSNLAQSPIYYLKYRDSGGVLRLNQAVTLSTNTQYRFHINFDAATQVLTLKIRNSADQDIAGATATYTTGTNTNDGFSLGKIGIATDGTGNSWEPTIAAWVDHITVDVPTTPPPSSCEAPGPDAGGYSCSTTTYSWLDTSGGTTVSLSDDSEAAATLPFTYTWYGQSKSTAYIGSNGLVCFASGCTSYNPPAPPSTNTPNDLVACYWEDLNPAAGGFVRYRTVGSSPSRTFVVEYNGVPHYSNGGSNTFQIQLKESGGDALCMYNSVASDNDGISTASATENGAGTTGVRYKYGEFTATSLGVRYSTSGGGGSGITENFDSGAPGWTYTGFWHVDSRRSYSPSNSVWYGQAATGTYDNGATNSGTVTSPTFSVPSSSPTLTFRSWHSTESGTSYDQKSVEISTDGGTTWTRLGALIDGTQSQWNSETRSLSTYAGLDARLRFKFDTIDAIANAYEGWFVDNVQVAAGSTNNPPTACFSRTTSGMTVTVNGACSSDADGDALTYSWNWGDGTPAGSGQSASHTYGCPPATYTITLTVNDGRGGSDPDSQSHTPVNNDGDGDGLLYCTETSIGTDPSDSDSDNDGFSDGYEYNTIGSSPTDSDHDNDGSLDGSDHDPLHDVVVRVTIIEYKVLDAADVFGNPADVYGRVTIAGTTQTSGVIGDDDEATPNWNFDVNVPDGTQSVSVVLELWDEDISSNDQLDVSLSGLGCDVTYDLRLGRWTNEDAIGDSNGYAHCSGDGDGDGSDDAELWFEISQSDADGDRLPFYWELNNGLPYHGYSRNDDSDGDGAQDWQELRIVREPDADDLRGFDVIVSLNWDASQAYMDTLAEGFRRANSYMWDVSDGYFTFGRVRIYDNSVNWNVAHVKVLQGDADQTTDAGWPRAHIGGISNPGTLFITMPETFGGDQPTHSDYFRTIIHEWGHYGWWLRDEYYGHNADGLRFYPNVAEWDGTHYHDECPPSIMESQYARDELDVQNDNAACTGTDQWHHETWSSWREIYEQYRPTVLFDLDRNGAADPAYPAGHSVLPGPLERTGLIMRSEISNT